MQTDSKETNRILKCWDMRKKMDWLLQKENLYMGILSLP